MNTTVPITSIVSDQQHERIKRALYDLRKTIKDDKGLELSKLVNKHKLTAHFTKACREVGLLQNKPAATGDLKAMTFTWNYKNDAGTDEVDNKLAIVLIDKIRDINLEYYKSQMEKKAIKKPKVTSAVICKEELTYNKVSHQILFLQEALEKEKQVKGYLRPSEASFFKCIIDNLEKLSALKDLLV